MNISLEEYTDLLKKYEELRQDKIRILNKYYVEKDDLKQEIEKLKEMKLHTEKYASEMEDKYILEKSKNNKAIEIYEECCKTQIFSTCDLDMYEALKGVDKE